MRLHPIRHEDDRRILTEYISDIAFRRAKVIETKGKVTLGKHYHNNSDSVFYILRGKGVYILKRANDSRAPTSRSWLFEGDCIYVPRGLIHTFELYPGTIMLETASEPFDKNDEIQVIE